MYETLVYSLIGALMGGSITYVIAKRMVNTDKIIEISDELLTEIVSNVEMQKKIYAVGVLLGNGIKQGIGIQTKGGKFKWEDVLMQGIAAFVQGKLKPQPQGENPLAQWQTP